MAIAASAEQAYVYPLNPPFESINVELSSIASQVSSQASAQTTAQISLLLLRKTLDLQAANMAGLMQAAMPASTTSNPPNLGNSVDMMA